MMKQGVPAMTSNTTAIHNRKIQASGGLGGGEGVEKDTAPKKSRAPPPLQTVPILN